MDPSGSFNLPCGVKHYQVSCYYVCDPGALCSVPHPFTTEVVSPDQYPQWGQYQCWCPNHRKEPSRGRDGEIEHWPLFSPHQLYECTRDNGTRSDYAWGFKKCINRQYTSHSASNNPNICPRCARTCTICKAQAIDRLFLAHPLVLVHSKTYRRTVSPFSFDIYMRGTELVSHPGAGQMSIPYDTALLPYDNREPLVPPQRTTTTPNHHRFHLNESAPIGNVNMDFYPRQIWCDCHPRVHNRRPSNTPLTSAENMFCFNCMRAIGFVTQYQQTDPITKQLVDQLFVVIPAIGGKLEITRDPYLSLLTDDWLTRCMPLLNLLLVLLRHRLSRYQCIERSMSRIPVLRVRLPRAYS